MAKVDFKEAWTEGWQFWRNLTTAGKLALAIAATAVYLGGGLTWSVVWALIRAAVS